MINWEENTPLVALTHLDGRNAHKLSALRPYFSELAWMKFRLRVIVDYSIAIAKKINNITLSSHEIQNLVALYNQFSPNDADHVVTIEKRVNHDVKALELYCESAFARSGLTKLIRYLNLGLGSEDINSIALGLQLVTSRGDVLMPVLSHVAHALIEFARNERDRTMIARTHASPANVTTFGKEVANSLSRLCDEVAMFGSVPFQAKSSGEVGTFQAFSGVDTNIDWMEFTDTFIRSYGLVPTYASTQIVPYDSLVRYLHALFRINSILLDFVKNMWLYVLLGYLRVRKVESEVGSSGMPHKVNPVYFEGAEGCLEMANGVIETLVRKLPTNRLQRGFSDSTLRRNIVLSFAYSLLAYQSIKEAISRIDVDGDAISRDLAHNAQIWIETVKTYGTTHGISDMYDHLKRETRGRVLTTEDLHSIIDALPLRVKEKQELTSLCDGKVNPYPGKIVDIVVKKAKKVFNL